MRSMKGEMVDSRSFARGRFLLRFLDPDMERQYGEYFAARFLVQARWSYFLGALLYVGFLFIDYHVMPESFTRQAIIRCGVVAPISMLIYLLSYSKYYTTFLQFAVVLVGAAGHYAMAIFSETPPFYVLGTTLILLPFPYLFAGIRFRHALLCGSLIVIGYELTEVFVTRISAMQLLYYNFFLLSVNGVGIFASHVAERLEGETFVQKLIIADEQKKSEWLLAEVEAKNRSLEESEERYRDIIQNATDGIFKNDSRGRFLFVNPAGASLLGYAPDELAGMNYRDLLPPDARDRVIAHFKRQYEEKIDETYLEFPVLRGDGRMIWLGQRVRLEKAPTGTCEYTGISRDITERVRADEELRRTKDAAEVANRTKSRFLASMSHELRTPLNSINGVIDMLRFGSHACDEEVLGKLRSLARLLREEESRCGTIDSIALQALLDSLIGLYSNEGNGHRCVPGVLEVGIRSSACAASTEAKALVDDIAALIDAEENQTRDAYQRVKDASLHLLEIIDSVLNLAMIESGSEAVHKTTSRTREVVDSAVTNARSSARSMGKEHLRITSVIREDVPDIMRLDRYKIGQVLMNLFSNAIKFTDDGDIDFEVRRDGDRVRFSIRDSGIGIREKDRERVFEDFERAEDARNFKGTGLGLAISKRLVELHGGDVGFESEYGKGSTFWFSLPL